MMTNSAYHLHSRMTSQTSITKTKRTFETNEEDESNKKRKFEEEQVIVLTYHKNGTFLSEKPSWDCYKAIFTKIIRFDENLKEQGITGIISNPGKSQIFSNAN
jgi:hypothetical protein